MENFLKSIFITSVPHPLCVFMCMCMYTSMHMQIIGLPGVGSSLVACEIMSLTLAIMLGDNRLYPLNHWFVCFSRLGSCLYIPVWPGIC